MISLCACELLCSTGGRVGCPSGQAGALRDGQLTQSTQCTDYAVSALSPQSNKCKGIESNELKLIVSRDIIDVIKSCDVAHRSQPQTTEIGSVWESRG